jgi:hypothetical protein
LPGRRRRAWVAALRFHAAVRPREEKTRQENMLAVGLGNVAPKQRRGFVSGSERELRYYV